MYHGILLIINAEMSTFNVYRFFIALMITNHYIIQHSNNLLFCLLALLIYYLYQEYYSY